MVPNSSSKANKKVQHTEHKGQAVAGLGAPSSWWVARGKFPTSGWENGSPSTNGDMSKNEQ
jgi:hypothetical protein